MITLIFLAVLVILAFVINREFGWFVLAVICLWLIWQLFKSNG